MKDESEVANLRVNIKNKNKQTKKTKIMASIPITSFQIEGEKVEVGTDFFFLVSRITMDSDCSHEIRR